MIHFAGMHRKSNNVHFGFHGVTSRFPYGHMRR